MEVNGGQFGDGNTQNNYFGAGFCSCGNHIQFRCQLCSKGLCKECDVIEFPKPPPSAGLNRQASARLLVVPVRGSGYLETSRQGSICWAIVGDRIARLPQVNAGFVGPLLRVEDIMPYLGSNSGDIRHLCCGCLKSGLPRAVEAICLGKSCEHPACGATPVHHCPCCEEIFCGGHAICFSYDAVASCHMCTFERMDGFGGGTGSDSRRGGIRWPGKRGGSVKVRTGRSACERDRCFDRMVNSLTASPGSVAHINAEDRYQERFGLEAIGALRRGMAAYIPPAYYKYIKLASTPPSAAPPESTAEMSASRLITRQAACGGATNPRPPGTTVA